MPTRVLSIIIFLAFACFIDKEPKKLNCHKDFSPEEMKADLHLLITKLKDLHPDLYRVISEEDLDKKSNDTWKNNSITRSYLEFAKPLAALLTDIGCVSTQWGHSAEYLKYRNEKIPLFPLEITIRDDKFFVKNNYSGDPSIEPGFEILKINDVSAGDLIEKNYPFLPTDGKIRSVQHRWLETYFAQHHSNFWEQPEFFDLDMKDKKGKEIFKKVPALLKKHIDAAKGKTITPGKRFYFSDEVAVMSLPFFSEKLNKYLDSCFTAIQNKKVTKLVINLKGEDMRGFLFAAELYAYLKSEKDKFAQEVHLKGAGDMKYKETGLKYAEIEKLCAELTTPTPPKSNAFKGDLLIITDGWTTNAKALLVSRLDQRPNTYFVGEECGACMYGMNLFPVVLTLPNTKILVYIPTVQIEMNKKEHSSLKAVKIDHPSSESDPEKLIQYAIELAKKKK